MEITTGYAPVVIFVFREWLNNEIAYKRQKISIFTSEIFLGELEALIVKRTHKPRIPIITVHQAKGLEYETVLFQVLSRRPSPLIEL